MEKMKIKLNKCVCGCKHIFVDWFEVGTKSFWPKRWGIVYQVKCCNCFRIGPADSNITRAKRRWNKENPK
jgi:hypothetical protein